MANRENGKFEKKTMQNQIKIYSKIEIDNFINQAVCLDISEAKNRFKAIELGKKAFWGSIDLVNEFEEISKSIKTETDLESLIEVLNKREAGEDEMANQVLLWYENIPFVEKSNYEKECAIWAKICAELKLARGMERFYKYSKFLKD